MKTRKSSAGPSKVLKKSSTRKTTPLGESIIRGLQEGISYARGEIELRTHTFYIPDEVDVRAVREKTGFSQAQFAAHYGFSPRTIQEWEQGRARPDSAVRAYLTVIDRNSAAVEEALNRGKD